MQLWRSIVTIESIDKVTSGLLSVKELLGTARDS